MWWKRPILCANDKSFDGFDVVLNLCNHCSLIERQEVVALGCLLRQLRRCNSESRIDRSPLDTRALLNLCRRQAECAQLLDYVQLVCCSQSCTVCIFRVLSNDTFDLCSVVATFITDYFDRHGVESCLDCCRRSTVTDRTAHAIRLR